MPGGQHRLLQRKVFIITGQGFQQVLAITFSVIIFTVWLLLAGASYKEVTDPSTFTAVACSANGVNLVATQSTSVGGSRILTSTNKGSSWVVRGPVDNWSSVASSKDGMKIVATSYNGAIYTSTDSGVKWVSRRV